jgi:hypothetical protein
MRIRKKLMLLHTLFSLGLAVILLVTIRPAVTEVVEQAEINEAKLLIRLALSPQPGAKGPVVSPERIAVIESTLGIGSRIRFGPSATLGLSESTVLLARSQPAYPCPHTHSAPIRARWLYFLCQPWWTAPLLGTKAPTPKG